MRRLRAERGAGDPLSWCPTPSAHHQEQKHHPDPGTVLPGSPPAPPRGEEMKEGMGAFPTEGTNLKLWENLQSHVNKCEITEHAPCIKPTLSS